MNDRVIRVRGTFEGTLEVQEDGSMRVIGVLAPQVELPLPGSVQNLRLLSLSDEAVEFAWDAAADASGYDIVRDGAPLHTGGALTFEDLTVTPGTTYTYGVRGVNSAGDGAFSELVVQVPEAELPAPDAPTNVRYTGQEAAPQSSQFIEFTWDNPGNVISWTIDRDGNEVGTVETPLFRDENVSPGSSYTYEIVATNASGSSDPAEFIGDTLPNIPPEWIVTTLPSGAVGQSYDQELNDMTADFEGAVRSYSLASGSLPPGLAVNGTKLNGTPSGGGGTYEFALQCSDGIDSTNQDFSLVVSVATDTTGPTAPTLGTPVVNGTSVSIPLVAEATDASGIIRYNIQRRINGGTFAFRAELSSASLFPFVENGLAEGTYDYRSRAQDASPAQNQGTFSNIVTAVVVPIVPNPDAPVNFIAAPSGATQNTLTWGPGAGGAAVTDYDLDFSTVGASGPWTAISIGLVTTYVHTGRTTGVEVFYRLKAKSATGESGYVTGSATPGNRSVFMAAAFENGRIAPQATARTQLSNRMNSGLFIKCVAKVQPGGQQSKCATTGQDGEETFWAADQGGAEDYDVYVTSSEDLTQGGLTDNIRPREKNYYLRSMIYAAAQPEPQCPKNMGTLKHYEGLNKSPPSRDDWPHTTGEHLCKPRSEAGWGNNDGYGTPMDTRFFVGWSWYLHRHKEAESNRKGHSAGPQLGENNLPGLATSTGISFHLVVPQNGYINAATGQPVGNQTDLWWCLFHYWNDAGTSQEHETTIALAPVLPLSNPSTDRGRWTDFICEIIYNPYLTAQTVNGWNFRANTGLLRVWKSTGQPSGTPHHLGGNGNRTMDKNAPIYTYQGRLGSRPRNDNDMHNWALCKHYYYALRSDGPDGAGELLTHPDYLGYAAARLGYAENRTHARATNSNMVAQYQNGVATTWEDVQPRAGG